MSQAIALLLLPAGLAGVTAGQFQALMEQLLQELAPSGPLEQILVAQVISYLGRLRKAALNEPADKVNDRDWLRYHSMAERGFWKHYNELMKGRRTRARTPVKAEAPAIAPAPVPVAVAPEPPAPPRPAPAPATHSRSTTTAPPPPVPPGPRPEPRRRADRSATTEADRQRWQAECLAVLADAPVRSSFYVPISVTPKAEPVAAGS